MKVVVSLPEIRLPYVPRKYHTGIYTALRWIVCMAIGVMFVTGLLSYTSFPLR